MQKTLCSRHDRPRVPLPAIFPKIDIDQKITIQLRWKSYQLSCHQAVVLQLVKSRSLLAPAPGSHSSFHRPVSEDLAYSWILSAARKGTGHCTLQNPGSECYCSYERLYTLLPTITPGMQLNLRRFIYSIY